MSEKRNQDFRIIVVDDSDLTRKTTAEILERNGFNVIGQAPSAEKGLQTGFAADAKLYIIDVVMPERSGIEMAKQIVENKTGVYIIMTSSLDMESIVIESISNGALDFLTKPFTEEELLSSVEKLEQEFSGES